MKQIQILRKISEIIATVLWLIAVIVITNAIIHHELWNLTPIIAHNRPQNYLGWIIIFAFIFTIISPLLKLVNRSK